MWIQTLLFLRQCNNWTYQVTIESLIFFERPKKNNGVWTEFRWRGHQTSWTQYLTCFCHCVFELKRTEKRGREQEGKGKEGRGGVGWGGGKRAICRPCDRCLIDAIRFAPSVWYSDGFNRLWLLYPTTFAIQLFEKWIEIEHWEMLNSKECRCLHIK